MLRYMPLGQFVDTRVPCDSYLVMIRSRDSYPSVTAPLTVPLTVLLTESLTVRY
jgi:hypothetical protein